MHFSELSVRQAFDYSEQQLRGTPSKNTLLKNLFKEKEHWLLSLIFTCIITPEDRFGSPLRGVMKQMRRFLLTGLFCIGSGIASNLHLNIDVVFFVPVGQMHLVDHL
ncbi:hypothetical protein ACSZMQ_15620 [Aeromonas rivipollensis]